MAAASAPPPPDALPSAAGPRRRCRTREVSSRYHSTPLPTQAAHRLSASSSHSTPMPSTGGHHHRPPATASATFVFGLADENRPPPTPGSRKRGAAPDLFDVMHRQRPGPGLNPPASVVSGATAATPSPRRALHPSRASPNVTTSAQHHRRGCARPSTPARTSSSFSSASSETSTAAIDFGAPASSSSPRRPLCSELRSSLPRTEGSGRLPDPFCFQALGSALPDCQARLSAALVKPPQQPARKVAVVGGNKSTGKQEDVHRLRVLENRYMQYRFLNAQAEMVAVAKNAVAEKSLCGLLERIAGLQKSVAEKRAEFECLKRMDKLHSIVDAQVPSLEQWSGLEREHSSCLATGTAALRDAASCVPILGNVRTNIGGVTEALNSAMEIMEQLSPYADKLSGKVEDSENVASELANVVARGKVLLQECADLLHQAHDIQVMEEGLRIHLMHL